MTKITSTLLLLALAAPLLATHNFSGEITFRKVGMMSMEVTITTYTKASSVNADRDSLTLNWGDGTSSLLARSNGNGEGVIIGPDLKKNTYMGTHDYAANGWYKVTMTDPNRVSGILNVNPPTSDVVPFYLEALFYLQASNNTQSPILLEPPVDQAILYQPFVHIPNAFDPDGDSLSYALVPPLTAENTTVPNYIYPYDILPGPDNQLTINPVTGKLTWDAPQVAGLYDIAIEVKAWRNGVLVEKILRDMLIEVRESNNLYPDITLNPAYTEDEIVEVSVGSTIQMTITAADPAQAVTLTATSGLLGNFFQQNATFVGGSGDGLFSWTVAAEHVRNEPYTVVFKANDAAAFVPWPVYRMVRFRAKATSGLSAPVILESLKATPNPAINGRTNLTLSNLNGEPCILQVFDAAGQAIMATVLPARQEQFQLNMSDWPSGLYWVKIQTSSGKTSRTAVVR